MTDVAELGFKVDSSQTVSATKNLDAMTAASQRSARAAQTFNTQQSSNTKSSLDFAKALQVTTGVHTALQDEVNKLNKANEESGKHATTLKAAFKSLSDVLNATGVQMGGAALQAGRLAGASSHLGGVATAAAVGVTAIATAAVAAFKAMTQLASIADTSKFSGFSQGFGQGVVGALNKSGLGTDDILRNMQSFGIAVREAQTGAGALAGEFRNAGLRIGDSEETLIRLADIMSRLTSDVDRMRLLTIAGIEPTRQMANFLSQGGSAVRLQIDSVKKLTDAEIEQARQVEKRWNEITTSIADALKKALIGVADAFISDLKGKAPEITAQVKADIDAMKAGGLPGLVPPPPPKEDTASTSFLNRLSAAPTQVTLPTSAPLPQARPQTAQEIAALNAQRIEELSQEQRRLTMLGDLANASDRARSKAIELELAWRQNADSAGKLEKTLIDQARVMQDGIELQNKLANGLIDSSQASELMTQKQHELEIQVAAGKLTQDEMNKALENYRRHAQEAADASAQYASKLPQLTRMGQEFTNLDKQLDNFATGALNNASTALLDFLDHTKSGKDAFADFSRSIVRAINEMIIKFAVLGPLAKALSGAFGGGAGGGGGFLASLFATKHSGGLAEDAGPMKYVNPLAFVGAPKLHDGLMPDEFPAILQRGERVIPRGGQSGNGNVQLDVVVNNTISDQAKIKPRMEQGPSGQRMVIDVVKQAQARGDFLDIDQKQFGLRRQKVR